MHELTEEFAGTIEETAAKPTRVRYGVLAALCAVSLVTYVDRVGFAIGAPYLKKDLGFNDQEIGYLLSAFFWAYGAFQILGGWLGDRLGSRHLLTILVLGWSLTTGAIALVVYVPGHQAQLLVPDRAPPPVRRVPGRGLPGHVADQRRLDARDDARDVAGPDLDVEPAGRCADPAGPGADVRGVRDLADSLLDPGRDRHPLVRGLLALVPRHPGGVSPGQRRRAEADRRRPGGAVGGRSMRSPGWRCSARGVPGASACPTASPGSPPPSSSACCRPTCATTGTSRTTSPRC